MCADRGLLHVSDEVYEYFLFDGARHFSPGAIPGSEAHTACIYSLSKAYGFASWRVGYMLFPPPLLEAAKKIQDTNVICAPRGFAVRGGRGARRRAAVGWGTDRLHRGGGAVSALDALASLGERVTARRARTARSTSSCG